MGLTVMYPCKLMGFVMPNPSPSLSPPPSLPFRVPYPSFVIICYPQCFHSFSNSCLPIWECCVSFSGRMVDSYITLWYPPGATLRLSGLCVKWQNICL